MKTLKDLPVEAQRHFDHYDLIGMYKPPGSIDELGEVLSKAWVDGGDSCHFTGIYHYAYLLSSDARQSEYYYGNMLGRLSAYEANLRSPTLTGGWKRHPDTKYWYSDDNRMSRDQATPMLCSLALSKSTKSLRRALLHFAVRGFLFATNTRRNGTTKLNHGTTYGELNNKKRNYNWKMPDPMLFDIWAIFIRGLNLKLLYPILLIADLQTYLNARLLLRRPEDTDVANFFLKHSLSRQKLPTFIGRLTDNLLQKLYLSSRVEKRYSAAGMPTFVGKLLQLAIKQFESKI